MYLKMTCMQEDGDFLTIQGNGFIIIVLILTVTIALRFKDKSIRQRSNFGIFKIRMNFVFFSHGLHSLIEWIVIQRGDAVWMIRSRLIY